MNNYLKAPGPKGRWLQGSLPDYRRGRLGFLEGLRRDYGTMVSYRLGPHKLLLACDPNVIKEVLVNRNKEFGRSFSTRMLKDFFGEGLLTSEGPKWLEDRRVIQPTFAASQIQSFGQAMSRQTADFIDNWEDGEERDALRDMQSLTMSIAAETLLGVKLADEVRAIHEPHDRIRENFDRRMESLFVLPRWAPTPYNRRVNAANKCIVKIVDETIAQRRDAGQYGPDILSRLMTLRDPSNRPIPADQIRNQVLTFLFAGHETTASMLGWVWKLLAEHPEVERKLHAELDSVLGGREAQVSDVPQLRFTDSIIREALRLYPSAYIMGRRALNDCELGGYSVPRETTIVISPWLMHRDAQFHENPLEFNPDRWSDEFRERAPQFAWFPFGAGPRKCIGDAFAMLEAVLVVATIAARYQLHLQPGQDIHPHPSVTIRPFPAVRVTCTQRTAISAPTM